MSLFRRLFGSSGSSAPPDTRFRPALQSLDGRDVPSVTFAEVSSDGTLNIRTCPGEDQIALTDYGDSGSGRGWVNASLNGRQEWFGGVNRIVVNDAGAPAGLKNQFTYTAVNDKPVGLVFYQSGDGAQAGTDQFTANLKGLAAGRKMTVAALGAGGNDTLQVNAGGRYQTGSGLNVHMTGGLGWDAVGVNAWGGTTMDVGSKMDVVLAANSTDPTIPDNSDNNVSFWYLGRMDGEITFDVAGSTRNDWVSANLWFNQGSRGKLGNGTTSGARVRGGDGNDDMQYIVRGSHTERLMLFDRLVADGGAGTNHLTRAATPPLDMPVELTRTGFTTNSTVPG